MLEEQVALVGVGDSLIEERGRGCPLYVLSLTMMWKDDNLHTMMWKDTLDIMMWKDDSLHTILSTLTHHVERAISILCTFWCE